MMIWINGAFGSGKSTTAEELHRCLPDSFVYDPEQAGYFIRQNTPGRLHLPDFQDDPLWRSINGSLLSRIAREYTGTILIPMTIVNRDYWDELVGGLRRQTIDVRCFTLSASRETLLQRLRSRGEDEHSWSAGRIDECVSALSVSEFGLPIVTDDLSPEAVAERIAAECGLVLV
ncbi:MULTISPECIES: AAA family ATPase [Saccharibacillus]|uniref:ATP-binding protein n=1 Tax=Saccharibacillus brassicae TaxID=2583377 RepID=A0A4Y6V386_SACBS|nr:MULTISPECIES: AAA family ATPase [Saccharibacillus]MWJ33837.1 AAA family ATPase [Saccharibacillus sp. WB 17]QDH23091.1 ATP-binding protein [Saccharibacillus brassicae]